MAINVGDIVIVAGQPHQPMTVIQQTVFGNDFPHWYKCGWITKDGKWQEKELPEKILKAVI